MKKSECGVSNFGAVERMQCRIATTNETYTTGTFRQTRFVAGCKIWETGREKIAFPLVSLAEHFCNHWAMVNIFVYRNPWPMDNCLDTTGDFHFHDL